MLTGEGAVTDGWPGGRWGRLFDACGERVDLRGESVELAVRRGELGSHLLILRGDLLVLGGEGLGAVVLMDGIAEAAYSNHRGGDIGC
jgi:hypothetical protein